jgi:hypothetical protein
MGGKERGCDFIAIERIDGRGFALHHRSWDRDCTAIALALDFGNVGIWQDRGKSAHVLDDLFLCIRTLLLHPLDDCLHVSF